MTLSASEDTAPHAAPAPVASDLFRVIADWYHAAIVTCASSRRVGNNASEIASAFGISVAEANLAINRLVDLGLLRRDGDVLVATNQSFVVEDKEITTPALRKYQRQILEMALNSLDADPFEERLMNGMTMAIDPAKLGVARTLIQDFMRRMEATLEVGEKRRVFQLGVQLYPLEHTPEACTRGDHTAS